MVMNSMKYLTGLIFGIALLIALSLGIRGCWKSAVADDERRERERVEWQRYVSEHGCKVEPHGWGADTWHCNGFDVQHYD